MQDSTLWSNLQAEFHLVGHTGTSYHIRPPHTYLFGRDDFAHFQIMDVLTSRRHCELRWEGDQGWLLVDLGSRNGTVVNGKRVDQTQRLKDHDTLRVGGQHFTFLILPKGADVASYLQTAADGNATYEVVPGAAVLPTGGAFNGHIGETGLLPILEFVLMTGKSGRLAIADDDERCMWFVDGALRDAQDGERTGQEVLDGLLQISNADFRFQEGVALPRGEIITSDPRRLLASLARGHSLLDDDDLSRAQDLQARMLQRIPSLAGYDVAVRYAAYSGIGGDFYDVGPLPDGRVLITLGDVSGHGVQGALVVAMALKTLRLLRSTIADPLELVVRFNEEVRPDLLPSQFITLFLAVLDPASGQVSVVLAGHHPGFLVDETGAVARIGKAGLVVGMLPGNVVRGTLSEQTVVLKPGDMLFQCTDGLLEARHSGDDEEFGTTRLSQTLMVKKGQAAAVLEGVETELKAFTAGHLDDDLTLLALTRLPA